MSNRCSKCGKGYTVVMTVSGVEENYTDYELDLNYDQHCGCGYILDVLKETLNNEVKVDSNTENLDCFPEVPLKNAKYTFDIYLFGGTTYSSSGDDHYVDFEIENLTVEELQ